jgi:hypothetical protein
MRLILVDGDFCDCRRRSYDLCYYTICYLGFVHCCFITMKSELEFIV